MMIPTDAIAIVTPHGRYERALHNRQEALPCGHRTAMDEIAWQRDTKTPGRRRVAVPDVQRLHECIRRGLRGGGPPGGGVMLRRLICAVRGHPPTGEWFHQPVCWFRNCPCGAMA